MKKIFAFLALLVSFAFGEPVSLSGTVTVVGNPAAPVVGAKVYLSNHPSITGLTGAQGDFTLTGTGVIRLKQGQVSSQTRNMISFVKNRITVLSIDKQSMKVELFNCRGERVSALVFNLAAGRNDITMGNDLQAHGMYMVRARIGNDNYTSTYLSMETSQWGTGKAKSSPRGLAKQKDSGMDSLVVSAKGYLLAKTGLNGYTAQNIAVAVQPFTPSGMKMIPAKDSTFQMGSESGDVNEQPVHSVHFTYDFYMDSTEVEQGPFVSEMVAVYPAYTPPDWEARGESDNRPAYYIDWFDAVLYCNGRSKLNGLDTIYSYTSVIGDPGEFCSLDSVVIDYQKNGFRLPTEAEWEYAYRAGTKTDWYFDTTQEANYAWCAINSQGKIYPVAGKIPNNFGMYDMSGNVWEWVNDWYGDYPSGLQTDPVGPDTGTFKIWRGGSWATSAELIRAAYRGYTGPVAAQNDNGLRCVLSR